MAAVPSTSELIDGIEKHHVLRCVGGYPLAPDLNSNEPSVKLALGLIEALGAIVALASFRLDGYRANFKSKFEAMNVLPSIDHALGRRRKASGIHS